MFPQSPQLVMKSAPTPGKVYPLTQNEMFVGRDTTNEIVISDAEVSRRHARLFLQEGSYGIEDLGSTNGTYVNGQRLMGPHILRPGETIMFGENISLVYEAPTADANATVAASPGQIGLPPSFAAAQPAAYDPPPTTSPVYSGQIPASPEFPAETVAPSAPAKKNNKRTWILAGCGCLLLLVCVCAAVVYAFDYFQLYCTPPFDAIFSSVCG